MKTKVEINKEKFLFIFYSILDFGLTYGGIAGVIVANYVSENNSTGYKIGLSGIILLVSLFCTAKHIYESTYQRKIDNYLQDLASTTNEDVKVALNKKINGLKRKQDIYNRIVLIAPFGLLYIVILLGLKSMVALETLETNVGLILTCLCGGSIFNLLKKPKQEAYKRDKLEYKVNKKLKK